MFCFLLRLYAHTLRPQKYCFFLTYANFSAFFLQKPEISVGFSYQSYNRILQKQILFQLFGEGVLRS